MNKIIIIISCLFTALFSKAQITYTPQTASGYQFKYVKVDSGFAIPYLDTTIGRGIVRAGAIVCKPSDKKLYVYNGTKWVDVSTGGGAGPTNKVDSVTIIGNVLFYWINGTSVGVTLPVGYSQDFQQVTDNGNVTTNDISANHIYANASIATTQLFSSDHLIRTNTSNVYGDSLRGYITGDSIRTSNLRWNLPDTTGTFVLSINGAKPDRKGNVSTLTLTPPGTDSSTTVGFGLTKTVAGTNINLKVDSSQVATKNSLDIVNAQVTANTAAITQRQLFTDTTTYDATKNDLTLGLATKQNTLVSGTNIKTVNGNTLLGSGNLVISAGTDTSNFIGSLYQKTIWANLTDFVQSGGVTASISSSKIRLSSGDGSLSQSIGLTQVRNTERWTVSTRAIIVSTGAGVGIGVNSTTVAYKNNAIAKLNTSTGQLTIVFSSVVAPIIVATSASNLSIANGDKIEITLKRDGSYFYASAKNLTAGGIVTNAFYRAQSYQNIPLMPNAGRVSLFSIGGTIDIDSLSLSSQEAKKARVWLVGDSKLQTYYTNEIKNRVGSLLQQNIQNLVISSGNSETTAELSSRVQEIIDGQPNYVLLGIGSNDVRAGASSAVYLARYDSIVTALTNAGIIVIKYLPFYEPALDQRPLLNHILTNYADSYIDTYFPILSNYQQYLVNDSVHPNDLYNDFIYNQTIASGKITGLVPSKISNTNTAGTLLDGDEYNIFTSNNSRFKFTRYSNVANTIEATDLFGTSTKRFDFRASEFNWFLSNSNFIGMQLGATGAFVANVDEDHTFGTSVKFHIKNTAAASGELNAGNWIGTNVNSNVIVPALNGTNGAKTQLGYFSSINGWSEGLSLANTSSSYSNLILMKSGGFVGVNNNNPTQPLDVAGSIKLTDYTVQPSATYTSGSTYTITKGETLFNPASVVSALTVTLSSSPVDGQLIYLNFGGTIAVGSPVITTLSFTGGTIYGTMPTTVNGGDNICLKYIGSTNQWQRRIL